MICYGSMKGGGHQHFNAAQRQLHRLRSSRQQGKGGDAGSRPWKTGPFFFLVTLDRCLSLDDLLLSL
jgi:hypothetical protein